MSSITMASSRQFELQRTQTRTDILQNSTQIQTTTAELLTSDLHSYQAKLDVDSVALSIPAKQAVEINILDKVFHKKFVIAAEQFKLNIAKEQRAMEALQNAGPVTISTEGVSNTIVSQHHYEYEATTFDASGELTLSNGTATEFNFHISYAREFERFTEWQSANAELQAPLVINFSEQAMAVSSKTIKFDLNIDGQLDDMPTLSAQAGFIAIDKNNNGFIDDGSELFGTKTGNGFFELSQYDDNGDGYINKNDNVFSKLLVWQPGAEHELFKLTDTEVDTLVLQSVETRFRFTDSNNQTLGQMRQTSLYANQDGSVGGLHQIDLLI